MFYWPRNPIQIYADFVPNKTNPANGTYKLMKTSIPFFYSGINLYNQILIP
jgi:hypothetical protein